MEQHTYHRPLLWLFFAFAAIPTLVAQPSEVVDVAAQYFNDLPANQTECMDYLEDGSFLTNGGSFSFLQSGLDFRTIWSDTREVYNGPVTKDGVSDDQSDFIGVNSFGGDNAPDVSPEGIPVRKGVEHNFEFNDCDGKLDLIFDPVDLEGYLNRTLMVNYWINKTEYDPGDQFVVTITDGLRYEQLLSYEFMDMGNNGSADDGTVNWQKLIVNLDAYIASGMGELITLYISVDNNSSFENVFIDNVRFTGIPVATACNELFISEYVNGMKDNKCLEIFNPSKATVDFTQGDYQLRFFFDGSLTPQSIIRLGGTIISGGTHVVCDDEALPPYSKMADQFSPSRFFTGTTVIELTKGELVLDAVGQLGRIIDYGSNTNMSRKRVIGKGDPVANNPFNLASEWIIQPMDETSLGIHESNCIQTECIISDIKIITTECDDRGTSSTFDDVAFGAVVIYFDRIPDFGTLDISGDAFASVDVKKINGDFFTFDKVEFRADGRPINITASFSGNPDCRRDENGETMAPFPCSDERSYRELVFTTDISVEQRHNCVEIYNPNLIDIDLARARYALKCYGSGNRNAGLILDLDGTISARGHYIICEDEALRSYQIVPDQVTSANLIENYDIIELARNSVVIDVIAKNGSSPTRNSFQEFDEKGVLEEEPTYWADDENLVRDILGDEDYQLLYDNPPASTVASTSEQDPRESCMISDIEVTVDSDCQNNGTANPDDDFFLASVKVTFSSAPKKGMLYLTGGVSAAIDCGLLLGNTYNFSGLELTCNGNPLAVAAYFSEAPECQMSELGKIIAPKSVTDHADCAEPFISEYVEGTGPNRCLEIFNPTDRDIDLRRGNYQIHIYFNGETLIGSRIPLDGIVRSGEVFVLCDAKANDYLLKLANQTSRESFFNGDDVVVLTKNGSSIDVIGQVGNDPGFAWGEIGASTRNQTLRRNFEVSKGDINGLDKFDPSKEWQGYEKDIFEDLGKHRSECKKTEPEVFMTEMVGCDGGNMQFDLLKEEWTLQSLCFDPRPNSDELTFAYQDVCGDFEFITEIKDVQPLGLAGIMIRENLGADSKFVAVSTKGNAQVYWQMRKDKAAAMKTQVKPQHNRRWMKLVRRGKELRAFIAYNPMGWLPVGRYQINLGSCAKVGLWIQSNQDAQLRDVAFRNVELKRSVEEKIPVQFASNVQNEEIKKDSPFRSVELNMADLQKLTGDDLTLMPNPTKDLLYVVLKDWHQDQALLTITDPENSTKFVGRFDRYGNAIVLDLNAMRLPSGMYNLSLKSGSKVFSKRFVKID